MNRILSLLFLILITSCEAQNCNDIKTGTFLTENENTGGSIIIRTESTQEEIVEKLGIHMKYDLIWTDDCSYALFNGIMIKGNDPEIEGKKTDTLFVEITKIIPKGYQFNASANFSDFISSGTAIMTSYNPSTQGIEENGEIENGFYTCNRFDWQINIPNGYEIRAIEDEQKLEEVGYETVKDQLPEGMTVSKHRPYLIGFGIDDRNFFSASFEPLEGTKKMTLPEHQKFVAKLISDSYATLNGIKSEQELESKKIGEYDFYVIKEKLYNQKTDELLLTQLIYNTYIKNHLFSVSINYSTEQSGKTLIENFENSLTK
jgi:hypothetical protein